MAQGIIRRYHLGQLAYIIFVFTLFIGQPLFGWPYFIRSLALILALLPIAYEGIINLFQKQLSTEFFLIIATVIAIAGHEETAITIVLLIMLVAHALEEIVAERTDAALVSLVKLIPTDVLIKKGSEELTVPLESVHPGMQVIIKTGGRVPVDGIIISGDASVQEAFLTGESAAAQKGPGELVYAGTFLEAGALTIEAQKVGENTLFGKISALLEEASKSKAQVVLLADRIAHIFTPAFIIFIAIVYAITGNINTIITLLVFGSPIELALVTPLTILAAITAAFKRGILIKGGGVLEFLASTSTMIFDKTGTLTMGSPEVVAIKSLDETLSTKDILYIAAIAEKKSGHVLAKAILELARKEQLTIPDPDTYISLTGHGITITYGGKTYMLGNRHFIEAREHGNRALPGSCTEEPSLTTFYLASEDAVLGQICLADQIRPDAQKTIEDLKNAGVANLMLLSGDKQEVAQMVGSQLGITKAYGTIMPDQKLLMLKELQDQGQIVTMIGDGMNDAPALKQANVGIALGGMGMEPAIQAADIVLMSGNLDQIVYLYELSRATMRTIKQNLIIGFALTHTVGIILALLSYLTPIQAALFHAIPDFLILLNAARLIGFKQRKTNPGKS